MTSWEEFSESYHYTGQHRPLATKQGVNEQTRLGRRCVRQNNEIFHLKDGEIDVKWLDFLRQSTGSVLTMSGQKPGSRFTDYFVVCGLDVEAGLEPDQLSGKDDLITRAIWYVKATEWDILFILPDAYPFPEIHSFFSKFLSSSKLSAWHSSLLQT